MSTAAHPTHLHPTSAPAGLPARLTVARVLTGLLEHLERSAVAVDPAQYRLVAGRLADELSTLQPDAMMDAWLRGHPIASETYENQIYAHAGLCRQPLDAALAAELQAKALIARASNFSNASKAGSARPATP